MITIKSMQFIKTQLKYILINYVDLRLNSIIYLLNSDPNLVV